MPATTAAKKDSAAQNGAPPRRDKSIAVLAFANLTRDPDNEYFSDGITEELLNVLAKVAGLRVTARTSAFFFKGKNVPIQEIAEKLGVGYVVEGSVRRSGNRVRITAQLIDAADGFHLWSENFDRELEDIFAVQDEIAGLIARHLELTLGQGARAARAVNPEAHRLVLEGRFYWNQRSEEGFRRATAAFTRALECDPEFAPALAGRADVAMMRANYRLIDGHKDVAALWDELTRDARAALELEPQAAEPHVALMYMHLMRGEFAAAESEHRQWEQLNPNCPGGRLFAGAVFAAQGRLDRATHELETAAGLDPLGVVVANVQVEMLLWSGQHQRALELNERAVGLRADVFPPNLGMRAALLAGLGRGGDAVEAARALRRAAGFKPRWWYDPEAIFALHRGGQAAEAAEYLAAMRPAWPEGSYLEGLALAALGRFDEALPFLARTPVVAFKELYWTRILDPFRGEPRFAQLIAGLGCAKEYQLARETFTRLNAR